MWSLLHSLFGTFNGTTYQLNDFVTTLIPGAEHYTRTLVVAGLTFAIGFIEYIYSFFLARVLQSS